jgi:hypothetical protein
LVNASKDLTASYQGGWYSLISLHGGGSPEAMKREIWRNYPVMDNVELVERLLDRGVVDRASAYRDNLDAVAPPAVRSRRHPGRRTPQSPPNSKIFPALARSSSTA